MTTFKRGDHAWIINQTISGTFIVEGKAQLIEPCGPDQWTVRFDEGSPTKVDRFVNKDAQADPASYVASLNA